jgi:2-polyprenyl-3-methyl-5-hydroxy-6-metoxy-1,4-benzoquinol methylase
MDLAGWEQRYRAQEETSESSPHPLVVEAVSALPPGCALDLACGTGHNALWLAQQGWSVTAIDGSATAIEILRSRAARRSVTIDAQIADLEDTVFTITPARYDLIAMCYYFDRNLIERCKEGLVPGGVMVANALLMEPGKEHSTFRLQPNELRGYFADWDILHYSEGTDAWQHKVAELVARRSALANM